MNLRDLDYLIAVADLEHFSRAAEFCNVSQPTLSSQISKLEGELGVKIFERDSRNFQITAIGGLILARARAVAAEVREMHSLAAAERDPMGGILRLGVIPTLSPYLAPLILPPLAEHCPKLRLEWREDLTHNLVAQFLNYELDFLLLGSLPPLFTSEDFFVQELFSEPFYLALPSAHPLADGGSLGLRDLPIEELLLLAEGHCLRDQVTQLCNQAMNRSQPPANDFRAASLETLLALVENGLGVTLIPALALPRLSRRLAFRPLVTGGSQRLIRLISRPNFSRPKLRWELGQLIQKAMPETVTIVNSL